MDNIPSHEKKFFYENCCHSATNPPKPLCFKHIPVVAARWEVAAKTEKKSLYRSNFFIDP